MTTRRQSVHAQLAREVGLGGRATYLLRVARVLPHFFRLRRRIESAGLDALRQRYQRLFTGDTPALTKGKYLRLGGYLRRDLGRAVELGLHHGAPKSILDLGSGAGYFLSVCEYFGHRALGVDVAPSDDEPKDRRIMHEFYSDMVELLGVRRTFWTIAPRTPLPELDGAPFDVVTAHQASFHLDNLPAPWGVSEWRFFVDDLAGRMVPGGRLVMMLNPDVRAGVLMQSEVRTFFDSLGAELRGWTVSLDWPALASARRGR